MANYSFSTDGPETGSVGQGETAIVNDLAFFDTDDTVTGAGASTLGFGISGALVLNLTGYSGITGFGFINAQATGSVTLTIGQDFYDANVISGAHLAIQGTALGGIVTLDASGLGGGRPVDLVSHSAGNDVLTGGAGDDNLLGGAGADQLNGGAGFDAARYDNATTGVVANLQTGINQGDAQGDIYNGIEGLAGSDFDDTLTGDGGSNALFGRGGNDVLAGLGGADALDGGDGIDTADYSASSARVIVDLLLGTGQSGDAAGDTLKDIETLVGSAFHDELKGDDLDNTLIGGDGNDILTGGVGADRLVGGDGNFDTVAYTDSTAGVTIDLSLGTGHGGDAEGDTFSGVENIGATAFNDILIGDSGANALAGGTGDDWLVGGAGADQLHGGVFPTTPGDYGIDTADYSASGAGITVDLVSGTGRGGDAEGDTLVQIDNLIGSAFADRLTGDAGANALTGGAGDDVLRGGAGADALNGGDGQDQANYQGSAAAVTVDLLNHTAAGGDAEGDALTGIENLYGSSFDDRLSGDDGRNIIGGEYGNDILVGNGGDDAINGEVGDDRVEGGAGNDRLGGAAGVDTIFGGDGNDSIDAGADNDTVSGDAGDDRIYGGTGDDTLDGGDGNDTLEGAAGADRLVGGAGSDTAVYISSAVGVSVNLATGTGAGGGSDAEGDTLTGIENLLGSNQADFLVGDDGANTLWGMDGHDVLQGGGGGDLLKGGGGNDRFLYTALSDSAVSGPGKDQITDFATGDVIDLSAIDADGNAGNGDTAFTFGTGAFTGHAGELRVVTSGAVQVVYVDTTGDKLPDLAINVTSDHVLTASDFVL